MKWTKMMMLAVTAVAVAVLGTGCAYFDGDETAKPFYRKGIRGGADANTGHAGANAGNYGDADLTGGVGAGAGAGTGDLAGMANPGAYKDGAGVNNYDGFGTPIPGVVFQPL
ncbi:MAG: hypothetical protein IKC08_10445, partial [Lentisphaeria bacterium]|nr:hypothetical protein [Lentisphaeria bacterium]